MQFAMTISLADAHHGTRNCAALRVRRISIPGKPGLNSLSKRSCCPAKRIAPQTQATSDQFRPRMVSGPKQFPYTFRFHCDCCGNGCSMVWCEACDGEGKVLTKPGGAGVPFRVGMARCNLCNGIGVVPCPLCGGIEIELPAPDPQSGPRLTEEEIQAIFAVDWASKLGSTL